MAQKRFVLTSIDEKAVKELNTLIKAAQSEGDGIDFEIIRVNGGSTDIGLEIVKLLENSPVLITGIVREKACSIAAIILQACDKRKMHEAAYLQYHYAHWRVSLLTYFDEAMMERNKQSGIELHRRLSRPVIKKTGMSTEKAHELFRTDRPIYAKEALELGLIDEIIH